MPLVASRPSNPYLTDANLDNAFVGQRELLRSIEAELRSPEGRAVLLYGPRRSGKSALLLQLHRCLPSPPLLPVYLDLRDRAHTPLGHVLLELGAALRREVQMPPEADRYASAQPSEAPFIHDQGQHFQREFLPALYQALPAGYRPLLLLDDVDALDGLADRLPAGTCGRELLPLLSRLLAEEPRLCFVFTSSRRLGELSTETRGLLKGTRERTLPPLDEEAAQALLSLSQAQGVLPAGPGATARALALSGGQPYLLRLLCRQALEQAWDQAAVSPVVVDAALFDAAAERTQKAAAPYLEERFGDLSLAERIVLSALAAAVPEGGAALIEELPGTLQGQGVRMMTREMELAPEALCERDLLVRRPGGGGLFFRAELLRRHVAQTHPVAGLRGELQQLVPAASALYEQALRLHDEGSLPEAQEALQRTLRMNPNHGGARLLLGQVLAEQGRLEDACRELEEAGRAGDETARMALLRTLLSLGEQQERSAEEERALQTYERAILLSPKDAVAQERRAALYTARADRAYALGDFEGARTLYEKAGRWERVAAVAERTKNTELRRLTADASGCEAEGDFDRAYALYQKLEADEPGRWQEAVARTRDEALMRQHYAAGQKALAGSDWDKALHSFGEVTRLRPAFQDTAVLLRRAGENHARALKIDGTGSAGRLFGAVPSWAWVLVLVGFGAVVGAGLWRRQPAEPADSVKGVLDLHPEKPAASRSGPKLPKLRVEPEWGQAVGRETATAALGMVERGELREALGKLQEAHRLDPHPGWLYDLGVIHDQLGECDDAGFFYRAALFGKGVTADDRPLVEKRIDFLDGECQFKRRQMSAADRHARASRFIELKLCVLAESMLSGIATPAEVGALERCLGRTATAVAPPAQKPSRPRGSHGPSQRTPTTTGATDGTGPALLTVKVTPGATVFLDGAKLGEAPLKQQSIPPGAHTVLLVNQALGQQSYSINASAGTTYTITYNWHVKH